VDITSDLSVDLLEPGPAGGPPPVPLLDFDAALQQALDGVTAGLTVDGLPSVPDPEHEPALPEFVPPRAGEELRDFPESPIEGLKLTPPPPLPTDDLLLPSPSDRPRIRPEVRVPPKAQRPHLTPPEPSPIVIGIDLGTTNCCAAVVKQGEAFVLASGLGNATTPSVVHFAPDGDVLVGELAQERASTDPLTTIVGSKRMMGRPFHSPLVQSLRRHFAYPLVRGTEGEAAFDLDGEPVSLEEVAAYLLRDIKQTASMQLGLPITRAVITCPAFYGERQRDAVRVAGELAGLRVERILSEPTAAALNYGLDRRLETRRVAVYDLGGGTFDVSILEVDGSVYEVLATGGDTFLGGIDFDACIAEMIVDAITRAGAPDPRPHPGAVAEILHLAETAKKSLTDRPSTLVHIRHLDGLGPINLSVPIRREEADARLAPLLEQTRSIVLDVCERARLAPTDVDDVLLVGGQTRYPAVRTLVTEIFGRPPHASVRPDEAVALGAAQYAAGMETIDNVILIDALAMSIGVGLPGGRFLKLIERDSRLPAQGSCLLPTAETAQSSMDVWFFQGESAHVQDAEPLGTLHVHDLPQGGIGEVTVNVELTVTEESVLEVRATESKTGRVFTTRFATAATPQRLQQRLGLAPDSKPEPPPSDEGRPKTVWKWLTSLFR
jgi:molecular chaperone DnaK